MVRVPVRDYGSVDTFAGTPNFSGVGEALGQQAQAVNALGGTISELGLGLKKAQMEKDLLLKKAQAETMGLNYNKTLIQQSSDTALAFRKDPRLGVDKIGEQGDKLQSEYMAKMDPDTAAYFKQISDTTKSQIVIEHTKQAETQRVENIKTDTINNLKDFSDTAAKLDLSEEGKKNVVKLATSSTMQAHIGSMVMDERVATEMGLKNNTLIVDNYINNNLSENPIGTLGYLNNKVNEAFWIKNSDITQDKWNSYKDEALRAKTKLEENDTRRVSLGAIPLLNDVLSTPPGSTQRAVALGKLGKYSLDNYNSWLVSGKDIDTFKKNFSDPITGLQNALLEAKDTGIKMAQDTVSTIVGNKLDSLEYNNIPIGGEKRAILENVDQLNVINNAKKSGTLTEKDYQNLLAKINKNITDISSGTKAETKYIFGYGGYASDLDYAIGESSKYVQGVKDLKTQTYTKMELLKNTIYETNIEKARLKKDNLTDEEMAPVFERAKEKSIKGYRELKKLKVGSLIRDAQGNTFVKTETGYEYYG